MQRGRRQQEQLNAGVQCHQKLVLSLKGAHRRTFLSVQLCPLVGMHKQLCRLLILSAVLATLDCIPHECQIYQLPRQPLLAIRLQPMMGRLRARNLGFEANHFKDEVSTTVVGWRKLGLTLLLLDDTTTTTSKSVTSFTLAM